MATINLNVLQGHSYEVGTNTLRIQNLRNVKMLSQLAKEFPETKELALRSPVTSNYLWHLNGFAKLEKLSLEDVTYFPDIAESADRLPGPPSSLKKLRIENASLLDEGFARLTAFLTVEDLDLSGVGAVAKEFWSNMDPILENAFALSIREIEMTPDFFASYLPKMRKLKRLQLSAFCSNPNSLRQLDVSELTELEELEISNVGILTLPAGFSKLKRLKRLNVSNSLLLALTDRGSGELRPSDSAQYPSEETIKVLQNLEVLDISGTSLQKLPGNMRAMHLREFRAASTALKSLPDCFLCESLEVLEIPNSSLESLQVVPFARLSALRQIDLSFSQLKSLPAQATCQKSLRTLSLQGISGLHQLPDWVSDCLSMKTLDLRQLQLEGFPPRFFERSVEFCDDKSSHPSASGLCRVLIKGIHLSTLDPKLLLTNDLHLLNSYMDATKRPIRRGNLIFLGDSGAGKRRLMERITGTSVSEWENCRGINILQDSYAFDYLANLAGVRVSRSVQVRMMEMSGRLSAQFIHPLFLTNHSLYVIVLDSRKEPLVQERAVWWARLVEAYAPNAHIIFAIWQDTASIKNLNIPLLRQVVWMDQEPEVVYLTGTDSLEESDLCAKIMYGLHSLLLAQLCLPESWIHLLSHFEQLLETRMMLHQDFFEQLMERYIYSEEESNNKSLQKYLLTFEGETMGRMAHTSVENMLFHTDWLGEGLYRLMGYAREHGGIIKNPRELWETLIDTAQRVYSFAHVEMLLHFCERQNLCYYHAGEYVFPSFTSELERIESLHDQDEYSEIIRQIQMDESATHYVVHCPILSQMMLTQLSTGLIKAYSDNSRIVTGQNGLLLHPSNNAGALLLLGQVGSSTKLHLYFSRPLLLNEAGNPESDCSNFAETVFMTLQKVLSTLPEHLRRQYHIFIQRSIGSLAEPRFAQTVEISMEELAGYIMAGRSSYFCGSLNQTFDIEQLGYLPSPL